jgi:hypothetical protein
MNKTLCFMISLLALSACDTVPVGAGSEPMVEADLLADDEGWLDPNLAEADLCSADADSVMPGDDNELFVALARDAVEIQPDVDFTVEDDSTVMHLMKGTRLGGLRCRCDGGCSGACLAKVGDTVATCEGTCDGLSDDGKACGGCSWHYDKSDGGETPESPVPTSPLPAFPQPLPAYPMW